VPQHPGYPLNVPTVVLDPQPIEIQELIARRRRLGQDLMDEVWQGVLHMNPAPHGRHARIAQQLAELLGPLARTAGLTPLVSIFNLGEKDDYRVPDGGLLRSAEDHLYYATAALVVEIVSPGDESWEKLLFYAAHQVDEVLIVDPEEHRIHWLSLEQGQYRELRHSTVIDLGPSALSDHIDWS
jgi:Uma2 family endonuclease